MEYLIRGEVPSVYKNAILYYLKEIKIDSTWLPGLILLFGINRIVLAHKIVFPIQSFDGTEWAKNVTSLLVDMAGLLKNNQYKLL